MWPAPDPNHKPKYHSLQEDIRDLAKVCWRVIKWPLAIVVGLVVVVLFGAAALNGAVPDWVWYWIVGAMGWKIFRDTMRQIVREEIERAKRDS
jgi:hypothetical protein